MILKTIFNKNNEDGKLTILLLVLSIAATALLFKPTRRKKVHEESAMPDCGSGASDADCV